MMMINLCVAIQMILHRSTQCSERVVRIIIVYVTRVYTRGYSSMIAIEYTVKVFCCCRKKKMLPGIWILFST